jgi:putative inorganic carbon (HCO3(-)) transporter
MTGALLAARLCLLGVLATFLPLFAGVRRGRRALAALLVAALVGLAIATALAAGDGHLAHTLARRWPLALLGLAAAVVALAVLVWLVYRFPRWAVPAMIVVLPLRLTVPTGGDQAHLLIPLYVLVVAVLIAEVVLRDRLRPPDPGGREPLRLALTAVIAVAGVSSLWVGYGYASLDQAYLAALVKLFAFYLPLTAVFYLVVRYARTTQDLLRLLLVLVWSGVGMALIGIVQYAGHFVFYNRATIAHMDALGQGFRVNSLFWDPNMFSRFLVIVLLICAALAAAAPLWRRWLAAAALVVAVANVFTLSRSGWAGLGAGLIIFVYVWLGRRRGTLVTAGLVVVFVAVFGALIVVRKTPLTNPHIFDHPWGINHLTGGRYYLATAGVAMFGDHPLAGIGLGGFPLAFPKYQDRHAIPGLRESHTTPLTILAEEGIVGTIAYLALLIVYFGTALRSQRRGQTSPALLGSAGPRAGPSSVADPPDVDPDAARRLLLVRAGLAAAVLATVIHSLLYNAWFEDPYVWVLLAFSTAAASCATEWPAWAGGARPKT